MLIKEDLAQDVKSQSKAFLKKKLDSYTKIIEDAKQTYFIYNESFNRTLPIFFKLLAKVDPSATLIKLHMRKQETSIIIDVSYNGSPGPVKRAAIQASKASSNGMSVIFFARESSFRVLISTKSINNKANFISG
jgi:hypothetical protein